MPQISYSISSLVLLCLTTAAAAESPSSSPPSPTPVSPRIEVSPKKLIAGRLAQVRAPGAPGDVEVRLGEKRIPLFPCPNEPDASCGFFGVEPIASPGTLEVIAKSAGGVTSVLVDIKRGKYRRERLRVDPALTKLTPEARERIASEREMYRAIYDSPLADPQWDGPMRLPAKGAVTSRFGNQRLFNGEIKDYHSGVDFRARTGTPIVAAAAGTVRLARDMFFAGNHVILDHGAGVFTTYAHLSRIDVEVGQKVKSGAPLGLSGATGRVTAPHLHWGMRVHGTAVDPIESRKVINSLW